MIPPTSPQISAASGGTRRAWAGSASYPEEMAVLDVLSPRTGRRHAHRTKTPTLVHLERATKLAPSGTAAFADLSLRVRAGQRWVVFSQERDSRSALLQCVAGLQQPERGSVTIRGHVSWPLGQVPGLSGKLSCDENSRFLLGIYGQRGHLEEELALVQELMGISREQWCGPLGNQRGAIMSRLKLALSLACDFDLYVINDTPLLAFRQSPCWTEPWQILLERRLQTRAVLCGGVQPLVGLEAGSKGLVLAEGKLVMKGALAECQAYLEAQRGIGVGNRKRGRT
jgi:ABC-type polysaccharide/polyol phosphate transport system ATPase subunit